MANTNNLVLTCFDNRIQQPIVSWIATTLGEADYCTRPGAAKAIIADDARESIVGDISLAKDLHGITTVHIIDHTDCGAYGGSGKFSTPEEEATFHAAQLERSAQILQTIFPEVKVKKYLFHLSEGKILPIE